MTEYILGGGCFWCLDAVYRQIRGVTKVETGYAGGDLSDPGYYQVARGTTGHAEVVRVIFDEHIVPSDVILDLFYLIHDPTTIDRQGSDVGPQYRSIMLYKDKVQKHAFQAAVKRAQAHWDDPIVTELKPLETFYTAEPEHQDYFNKNPESGYCQIVVAPKVSKARSAYKQWLKDEKS
jgi:peptide-methionine (S)-S-oxide reductase